MLSDRHAHGAIYQRIDELLETIDPDRPSSGEATALQLELSSAAR